MKVKLLLVCSLALTACGGVDPISDAPTPIVTPQAPAVSAFTASPETVAEGGESTLVWALEGEADTLALTSSADDSTRSVMGETSVAVSPSETTTYTLTAANEGGRDVEEVTVAVAPADEPTPIQPAISAFTAVPSEVAEGEETTLSWTLEGGDVDTLVLTNSAGSSGQRVAGETSVAVSPSETTTYTLTAANSAGSDAAEVTVTVIPAENPAPPVQAPDIASFTATPETLEAGQSSTLTWDVTGGEAALTIDNGVGAVTGGSVEVSPGETTTYTLTATNESGSDTRAVTVVVSEAVVAPPEEGVLEAGDLTVEEEGPFIEVDVLGAEDTDYPDEGYTFPEISISSEPDVGVAFTDDGSIIYDSEGFVGTTIFEYTLSITNQATGEELSDAGTVTLNVQ